MSRVPRNYDGSKPTSKTIKELLPSILEKLGTSFGDRGDMIITAWPTIIGDKLSAMTRAVSFQEGVLHVVVKNSTLYSVLSQHDKPKLLKALRDKFPKTNIKNIFFRIG
ncbi:MAG: DUF721 domain-containing protein [Chlamydiales bacterium]|nr:DUF721 domain-containing protein [Chlamydiales bacterium]